MRHQEAVFHAIGQIQHLASIFGKRRAQLAQQVDLTEAQWRVLEGVATEHFMPSLFADGLDNSRGAVSKILRQLQEKNLAEASIASRDARQRKYQLTGKGKRVLGKLRKLREVAIREIWSDLPANDLTTFNQVCDRLIGNLRDYANKEDD